MKQTDGLFHKVFDEIAPEYPEIETQHMIIDIGTARLADTPEDFDVIVVPNLYGDIISDVVAQITGSVGLAGSANIGTGVAMFEAIHGSAPDIAGQGIANPSGLLQSAIVMLNHIGENTAAVRIQNAWLKTLEEGLHTADIYSEGQSQQKLSTKAFTEAVIANLDQDPKVLQPVQPLVNSQIVLPSYQRRPQPRKDLLGVDVFVDWAGSNPEDLAARLRSIENDHLSLSMITNRGIKVWPNGFDETFCTDHWRCRFQTTAERPVSKAEILALLTRADEKGIDTIKTENLYAFDGQAAFSLGQGQ